MTYKVVRVPQHFYEDKKSLSADEAIQKVMNDMGANGYEYVGVVVSSSEIHSGCCCCKKVAYRYDNQLVFKHE